MTGQNLRNRSRELSVEAAFPAGNDDGISFEIGFIFPDTAAEIGGCLKSVKRVTESDAGHLYVLIPADE